MSDTFLRPSGFSLRAITVTASVAVSSSEDRTALTLTAVGADIFVTPNAGGSGTDGLRISAGAVATVLCGCHQGDFVRKQLFAFTSAGTGTLAVIEGFETWPSKNQ